MAGPQATTDLKRTPLHGLHVRLGARMVAFAGYDMPVQYPTGIIKEHLHTRSAAGLFDVCRQIAAQAHRSSGSRCGEVGRLADRRRRDLGL